MSKSWRRGIIFNATENRYIDAVMQGDTILFECGCLSESFISQIISHHNNMISEEYKRGLYDGAGIAKEIYKEDFVKCIKKPSIL